MRPPSMVLVFFLASMVSGQGDPTSRPLTTESIACTKHTFASGCAPLPFICKIHCNETMCLGEDGKEDIAGGACTAAGVELGASGEFTEADMTEDICKAQCFNSNGFEYSPHRCRFWRYDHAGNSKTCTLMSEEQCMTWDECLEESCKMGDEGCPADFTDPPNPANLDCKGPIEYNDQREIHWSCRNADSEHLSAYSPDEVLPHGTVCDTNHKCADWGVEADQRLHVTCEEGHWIPKCSSDPAADCSLTNEYYKPVLGDSLSSTDPILEPPCTGGGVKLRIKADGIDQPGAELICETPIGEASESPSVYIVDAPNACVLLCNHLLGWTLESNLDDQGKASFSGDNGPFAPDEDNTPNGQYTQDVKCWDS